MVHHGCLVEDETNDKDMLWSNCLVIWLIALKVIYNSGLHIRGQIDASHVGGHYVEHDVSAELSLFPTVHHYMNKISWSSSTGTSLLRYAFKTRPIMP